MSGWPSDQDDKAWRTIERVLSANTLELKRQSRWRIFFRILTFLYLGAFLFFVFHSAGGSSGTVPERTGGHMAKVQVRGLIAEGQEASAERLVRALEQAFSHRDTQAVLLEINSPGGSPVQSHLVYEAVLELKQRYDKPVYALIGDTGASGAYYIAASADYIYAHPSSLVGSIGVTSASFGFEGLIDQLGIERRNFTAGSNKSFLDPFLPVSPEQQAHMQSLLANVHQQFVDAVVAGRDGRLRGDLAELTSGLIWTGEQAVANGLVDQVLSLRQLSEREQLQVVDFSERLSPFDLWLENFAMSMGKGLSQSLTQSWQLR